MSIAEKQLWGERIAFWIFTPHDPPCDVEGMYNFLLGVSLDGNRIECGVAFESVKETT